MESVPRATGCFKCGLTGHWSRDCTSQKTPSLSTPEDLKRSSRPFDKFSSTHTTQSKSPQLTKSSPAEPPPKESLRRKRPKLTPELLLSENGLEFIQKTFPKSVMIKGKGHELGDLRRLLEAYMHWHTRLFPLLTFPEFIQRVEIVGANRRVRDAVRGLRDNVDTRNNDANAPILDENALLNRPDGCETAEVHEKAGKSYSVHYDDDDGRDFSDHGLNDVSNDLLEETIRQSTDEGSHSGTAQTAGNSGKVRSSSTAEEKVLTTEQLERMEANRKLALERARNRISASKTLGDQCGH